MASEQKGSADGALSHASLDGLRKDFFASPKNELAMNVVCNSTTPGCVVSRSAKVALSSQDFSVKIPAEAKITAQKSSGRCWIFAALNVVRLPFMAKHNITDFEFSQTYIFFYDKLEKANFFLESIISTVDKPLDDRLLAHLLKAPVNDGGQYDMFINIVDKYGMVPKDVFPETASSGDSKHMNWIITAKLREFARDLRTEATKNKDPKHLRALKDKQMSTIYRILTIHLGDPPKNFTWSFRDKDKKFQKFENLTPRSFYEQHVPLKVENYVSLINDPRNKFDALFTVDFLGNVAGGKPVQYINVDIDVIKKYARSELEAGRAVWFGCDVGKFLSRTAGVMDLQYFDYNNLLDTDFGLSKADRLRYGHSLMTHAMVFTAVDIGADDKPTKWRVENSWGEARGEKGYFVMTDAWFDQFMYQIVVDKNNLPAAITDILKQQANVLPAWDPMGSLAQ